MTHLDWDHPPELAEVRRWRLLTAGRRVIERQGLDSFTIEDITREARVAKGTFYTYFRSRDEFLDALRGALGSDVVEAVRAAAEGPWDGIFVRMMAAVTGWLSDNPGLRVLFGPAYMSRSDRPTRGPLFAVVSRVVGDGIEAGILRPLATHQGDPVEATAVVVYDVLSAGVNRVSPVPDAVPIESTAEFVQLALGFDEAAARGRVWTSPPA